MSSQHTFSWIILRCLPCASLLPPFPEYVLFHDMLWSPCPRRKLDVRPLLQTNGRTPEQAALRTVAQLH